jgi:hypothetical protein
MVLKLALPCFASFFTYSKKKIFLLHGEIIVVILDQGINLSLANTPTCQYAVLHGMGVIIVPCCPCLTRSIHAS